MSDNLMLFGITSSLGNYIGKIYDIPPMYSTNIGMLLMYILTKYSLDIQHIYGGIAIFISYYLYKMCKRYLLSRKSYVELHRIGDTNVLKTYMEKYRDFFDTNYNMKFGNIDANESRNFGFLANRLMLANDQIINFNDKNFNIKGYIEIIKYNKNISSQSQVENRESTSSITIDIPIIYVYKNDQKIIAYNYLEMITKRNRLDSEKSSNIELSYVKVFAHCKISKNQDGNYNNHTTTMYKGPKETVKERRIRYMKTFFHQEKKYILTLIDKIHNDPDFFTSIGQTAQMNLILYGPPGTGKSSFVHRLAMSYNRHIISVDLTNVKDKSNVYQIIQCPCVYEEFCHDPSEYIILLEEFDIVVNILKNKRREQDTVNIDSTLLSLFGTDKTSVKKDGKENYFDSSNNADDFYLEDLLEIIQGPVPRHGQIIIATTNKFDEIYEACPALFRPGRLTPIKFDYLNQYETNKLIKYYLGRDDIKIDRDPKIATSKIIEIIMYAKITENFDYILQNLK
jgi:hypothetical protein